MHARDRSQSCKRDLLLHEFSRAKAAFLAPLRDGVLLAEQEAIGAQILPARGGLDNHDEAVHWLPLQWPTENRTERYG